MAPSDVFDAWTSRGLMIWLQPVSCTGGTPRLDGWGGNRAAMSEAAKARRSHAGPVVQRPADELPLGSVKDRRTLEPAA